jgi:hypothetical protein
VDLHFHVGLLGDSVPQQGALSDHFRKQPGFDIFLAYARVPKDDVCDRTLREATEAALDGATQVDRIVCLALDPVYDRATGDRRPDLSHMWVDNGYVLDLQRTLGEKVLLGASIHPYDPHFAYRLATAVDQGAVLLKWIPSAQGIDLADSKVLDALKLLAKAKDGKPLPLLLHNGPEYAVPPVDPALFTNDFLSWSSLEAFVNALRGSHKKRTPNVNGIHQNLRSALAEGATIIFAHCGFPYFASGFIGRLLEHSDHEVVRGYLERYRPGSSNTGSCFADVSACCTPFRRPLFEKIRSLPSESVLFGSDFPTPVFELHADLPHVMDDFEAVLRGEIDRAIIPEGNLVDVNYDQLQYYFPAHPLFTNFDRTWGAP